MRFRQIHLDFHTSGLIPGIGSRFDAEAFGRAFKDAHVDSVTVFSKCHHGYSYHPTQVGTMHPGLNFNLLRAQIDALHAVGINAPVYLTATWDELAAIEHPEWRIVAPDNSLPHVSRKAGDPGWAYLDYATPYLDHLCAQTEEVMQMFPDADGIFMDISFQLPSVSEGAKAAMTARGLDWTRAEDRVTFAGASVQHYFDRVTDAVRRHDPKMPLFFNSGHIRRGLRQHYHTHYSHLELESLPTAGWGYEHFPLSARYVEQIGLPYLGMTGKFHWLWGEVGGYKTPDALIYECGAMLAQGAHCSIGDHLHPTAQIDASTMRVIGPAYEWVADREPWCIGTLGRAEIGLLSVEAAGRPVMTGRPDRNVIADDAAVRVLMEGQFSFDVLDLDSDFSAYALIILPDAVRVDAGLKAQLDAYLAQGGRLLLTGKSGLAPEGGFAIDVGADWVGTSAMTGGDYLLPDPGLRAEGVHDPLFMYLPSEQVRLTGGTALGAVHDPYFDRTPRHFSGHVNAPSQPTPTGFPAIVEHGPVLYAAHPIFTCYHTAGAVAMLEIAEALIHRALGRTPMIRTSLPRAGRATLRHSPDRNSDILHLMHATPALRGTLGGQPIQPIQDLITLTNVAVSLAPRGPVAKATLVPEMTPLNITERDGRLHLTVPRLRGHQMVEITYHADAGPN
jgi:hypothetical protein